MDVPRWTWILLRIGEKEGSDYSQEEGSKKSRGRGGGVMERGGGLSEDGETT
jgi:hypothetical protein